MEGLAVLMTRPGQPTGCFITTFNILAFLVFMAAVAVVVGGKLFDGPDVNPVNDPPTVATTAPRR